MSKGDLGAIKDEYLKALEAYASASAVLDQPARAGTEPTATDLQRLEDARVIFFLEAAKATYDAAC